MSASTHEAVLGGARWRLTLHPDGRWDVARRLGEIWDELVSGDRGITGLRDSADDVRNFSGEWHGWAGADALEALADVAERSTTP